MTKIQRLTSLSPLTGIKATNSCQSVEAVSTWSCGWRPQCQIIRQLMNVRCFWPRRQTKWSFTTSGWLTTSDRRWLMIWEQQDFSRSYSILKSEWGRRVDCYPKLQHYFALWGAEANVTQRIGAQASHQGGTWQTSFREMSPQAQGTWRGGPLWRAVAQTRSAHRRERARARGWDTSQSCTWESFLRQLAQRGKT